MERTTLYLPAELLATYSALARRQRRTKADLMRDALREYAERQEQPLPDWIGMIESAGELDSSTVDDWLREYWKPE